MTASAFSIPTVPGVPYYVQRTRLDGREFNLRLAWNEREALPVRVEERNRLLTAT